MPSRENEYYARRWQDFQRLDRMHDHWWWRPGWTIGLSFYTWHITFENSPDVHHLAAAYQQRITLPSLDPVPPEGLHMTLQGVGFTHDVTASDIEAITAEATARCATLSPFLLTLGPADGDLEGVPLAVRPWEPVERLRLAIRDAIAAVWGADQVPEPADGFHPHVTLFYSNTQADPAPLRALLAELRDTPPVDTSVRAVSLIRLDRDEKVYRWTTVAAVPFSGPPDRPRQA